MPPSARRSAGRRVAKTISLSGVILEFICARLATSVDPRLAKAVRSPMREKKYSVLSLRLHYFLTQLFLLACIDRRHVPVAAQRCLTCKPGGSSHLIPVFDDVKRMVKRQYFDGFFVPEDGIIARYLCDTGALLERALISAHGDATESARCFVQYSDAFMRSTYTAYAMGVAGEQSARAGMPLR